MLFLVENGFLKSFCSWACLRPVRASLIWAWHFPPPLLGHLSASWFLSAQFFLLCQPESILPTSQKAATKSCEMRGWC